MRSILAAIRRWFTAKPAPKTAELHDAITHGAPSEIVQYLADRDMRDPQ